MGKKLAIKGHPTRGKEVIELLEMMGGDKIYRHWNGDQENMRYFINGQGNIDNGCLMANRINCEDFTLEEFLEKYPFKVGDKVIDKADGCLGIVDEMKWDEDVSDMKYFVAFGNGIDFGWFANDSIEFCKENKNLEENNFPSFELMFKLNDELEYKIPDGYKITEVSKNTVFIKPIKPKYPASYVECCEVLGIGSYFEPEIRNATTEECYKFTKLMRLKRCCNAYWKIYGEELGLGKPWEPDWNEETNKFTISNKCNKIYLNNTAWYAEVLSFPTAEMRDAFYENFKDLIEQCKELL